MPNTVQLKKNGQPVFPVTDVSLVMGLAERPLMDAVYAWDGTGTPDITKIPAGVTVEYNSTTYTGTLAASADTTARFYLVPSTTVQGEYDRYLTDAVSGSYSWKPAGTTAIPTPSIVDNLESTDPTKALSAKQGKVLNEELGELEAKVDGYNYDLKFEPGYINYNGVVVPPDGYSQCLSKVIPPEIANNIGITYNETYYKVVLAYFNGSTFVSRDTNLHSPVSIDTQYSVRIVLVTVQYGTSLSVEQMVRNYTFAGLPNVVGLRERIEDLEDAEETIEQDLNSLQTKAVAIEGGASLGQIAGSKTITNKNGVLTPAYTVTSNFFAEWFQNSIRGSVIYGLRLFILTPGTLTITKATGVSTNDCQVTNIKAFTVSSGWQVLVFDSPFILSNEEWLGVGINSDNATVATDSGASAELRITYIYKHASVGWTQFTTNAIVSVLGFKVDSPETGDNNNDKFGIGIVDGYKKIDNTTGEFAPIYSLNSYFPNQGFQGRIRNTAIYGVRMNVKTPGTFTIVKATGVKTDNCVMTTIKSYTIKDTGWQSFLFDAPVILSDEESIGFGVSTDTAKLVIDSAQGGQNAITSDYLHYSLNTWVVYGQNMLIDILGIPQSISIAEINSDRKKNVFTGENLFRTGGVFFAHLFLDKIFQDSSGIYIPSESIMDIRVSQRLGYKMIEANVHKTSDGKYIVIHGVDGKFGYEVTDTEGQFTYADTAINSVNLSWIKENIRYRSNVVAYRRAIPTLEEFLMECKIQGMIPMCQANEQAIVSLLDGIMGYGNYIAYNSNHTLTSAPVLEYLSYSTKEQILSRARSVGLPYIYSFANINDFTDEELADIIGALHTEGFMAAGAYLGYVNTNRLIKAGCDIIASSGQATRVIAPNICNISSGTSWEDFTVTGATPGSGGIELNAESQTITPHNAIQSVFLGKNELSILFSGKIQISFGEDNFTVLESDGGSSFVLGNIFVNSSPSFIIKGHTDGATIYDVSFKAEKC